MNKENLIESMNTDVAVGSRKDGTPTYSQDLYLWGTEPFPQKFTVQIDSPSDVFQVGLYSIVLLDFFEIQTNFGNITLSTPRFPKWKEILKPVKK